MLESVFLVRRNFIFMLNVEYVNMNVLNWGVLQVRMNSIIRGGDDYEMMIFEINLIFVDFSYENDEILFDLNILDDVIIEVVLRNICNNILGVWLISDVNLWLSLQVLEIMD